MARRRQEDGRVGSACRGMVRRWGRVFSRVRPRVSQIARGGLSGATPRGQPWTSAVTLPPGRNGLIAWRITVLSPFRAPSRCRHGHRACLRSVWLAVPPIRAASACHQRNYIERFSRFRRPTGRSRSPCDGCDPGGAKHAPGDVTLMYDAHTPLVLQD
jgi:hypothetical protein